MGQRLAQDEGLKWDLGCQGSGFAYFRRGGLDDLHQIGKDDSEGTLHRALASSFSTLWTSYSITLLGPWLLPATGSLCRRGPLPASTSSGRLPLGRQVQMHTPGPGQSARWASHQPSSVPGRPICPGTTLAREQVLIIPLPASFRSCSDCAESQPGQPARLPASRSPCSEEVVAGQMPVRGGHGTAAWSRVLK